MAGDAYQVIEKFWKNQDSEITQQQSTSSRKMLFSWTPYMELLKGRQIGAFLLKMNQAVKSINGVFRLEQLSGNETTAWAQWSFTSDHGYREA